MATEKLKMVVSVKDQATKKLKGIATAVVGIGAAYIGIQKAIDVLTDSFNVFAEYEANMVSLEKVVQTTGRSMIDVYAAMETQLGGLASKATIASGFLKGMTTTLTVDQINNMTTSIRDASIAMGESFEVQFPLIIKAIKQLNPAILDNIGVTVRLDKINKQIRDGYFGMGTEINEATQQHAIYTEILKQTNKFQGLEAELLGTTKGKLELLNAEWTNFKITLGEGMVSIAETIFELFERPDYNRVTTEIEELGVAYKDLAIGMERTNTAFRVGKITMAEFAKQTKELDDKFKRIQEEGGLFPISVDPLKEFRIQVREAEDDLKVFANRSNIANMELNELFLEFLKIRDEYPHDVWLAAIQNADSLAKNFNKNATTMNLMNVEANQLADSIIAVNAGLAEATKLAKILNEQEEALIDDNIVLFRIGTLNEMEQIEDEWTQTVWRDLMNARFQHTQDKLDAEVEAYNEAQDKIAEDNQRMNDKIERALGSATKDMVRLLFGLEKDAAAVFKNMAMDFLNLFIEETLRALAAKWAPKFLGFLGGLFDTPANDRMAMQQGEHFAHYFVMGAEGHLNSINFGAKVTAALNREFIEGEIVPVIEEGSIEGVNRIPVFDSNMTGKADITFS